MLLGSSICLASPTNGDTVIANKLLDSLVNTQNTFHQKNKRYEQVKQKMGGNKIVYYMHEYKGECGEGYIATASKVINYREWIIQRHAGCENDRDIKTTWTQIN